LAAPDKLSGDTIKQELVPILDMEEDTDDILEEGDDGGGESFELGLPPHDDEGGAGLAFGGSRYDAFCRDYGAPPESSRAKVINPRDGGGRFQCALCFKRYKTAGSLQNHRSIYHRNEIGKNQKTTSFLLEGVPTTGTFSEAPGGGMAELGFIGGTADQDWRP
jgi:hypothetical protein